MRGARILVFVPSVAVLALTLAPGCRDATQATVDISLAKGALCTEIKSTAITVGTDPRGTEDRVAHEFVTATTSTCDSSSGEIGTLVLTPSGSGRASVIVVVAYGTAPAASCKPPLFAGCIVARRQFSFTDHRNLVMPISIDPDCKDVPCDAFSTCRSGKCFSSEATCTGDACSEPGDPGDGGTLVDGEVDTGMPHDAAKQDGGAALDGSDSSIDLDSSVDGGVDAQPDGPLPSTRCTSPGGAGSLVCGNMSCSGSTNHCCGAAADTATCSTVPCPPMTPRYCCDATDCGAAGACPIANVRAGGVIGGGGVGTCPSGVVVVPPPPPPAIP